MAKERACRTAFTVGERVLCHEPDNTKARLIYEAQVLEIHRVNDAKGRRVTKYYMKFRGWDDKWNCIVPAELLLKDNEENRKLQLKYFNKYPSLKQSRRYKFSKQQDNLAKAVKTSAAKTAAKASIVKQMERSTLMEKNSKRVDDMGPSAKKPFIAKDLFIALTDCCKLPANKDIINKAKKDLESPKAAELEKDCQKESAKGNNNGLAAAEAIELEWDSESESPEKSGDALDGDKKTVSINETLVLEKDCHKESAEGNNNGLATQETIELESVSEVECAEKSGDALDGDKKELSDETSESDSDSEVESAEKSGDALDGDKKEPLNETSELESDSEEKSPEKSGDVIDPLNETKESESNSGTEFPEIDHIVILQVSSPDTSLSESDSDSDVLEIDDANVDRDMRQMPSPDSTELEIDCHGESVEEKRYESGRDMPDLSLSPEERELKTDDPKESAEGNNNILPKPEATVEKPRWKPAFPDFDKIIEPEVPQVLSSENTETWQGPKFLELPVLKSPKGAENEPEPNLDIVAETVTEEEKPRSEEPTNDVRTAKPKKEVKWSDELFIVENICDVTTTMVDPNPAPLPHVSDGARATEKLEVQLHLPEPNLKMIESLGCMDRTVELHLPELSFSHKLLKMDDLLSELNIIVEQEPKSADINKRQDESLKTIKRGIDTAGCSKENGKNAAGERPQKKYPAKKRRKTEEASEEMQPKPEDSKLPDLFETEKK